MLDGPLRNQVNHSDRPRLVFAPGACNALLQPSRVPRQIAINDHAGVLQVQSGAAGIRTEKYPAVGIILKK